MNNPSLLILALAFALSLGWAVVAIFLRSAQRDQQIAPIGDSSSPADQAQPPPTPVGKVNTWFYRRGDLLGISLLFVFFALTSLTAMTHPEAMDMNGISAVALLAGIAFQMVVPIAVIAAALRLTSLDKWLGLRWKNWPLVILIAPASVALISILFVGIEKSGYLVWLESMGVETKQDTVALLENTKDELVLGLMIVLAVVIAPLWEEVVFRGYLYPVLKKYGGMWTGALCSSLLFAAVHNNLAALLPLFLLALMMVWLYELTGSIWTPIAIHACFNALAVIGTIYVRNTEPYSASLQGLPFF